MQKKKIKRLQQNTLIASLRKVFMLSTSGKQSSDNCKHNNTLKYRDVYPSCLERPYINALQSRRISTSVEILFLA